jgi:hypothetical protein
MTTMPLTTKSLPVNMQVSERSCRLTALSDKTWLPEPGHDRGQAAFAGMSNPYCDAVPRLYRDRFAATRACHLAGVGRALT